MKSNNFKQTTGFQSIFSHALAVLCFLLTPNFVNAQTENEVTATWLSNLTEETTDGKAPSYFLNVIDIDKTYLKDYLKEDFNLTPTCSVGEKLNIVNSFVTYGSASDGVTINYDTYFLELQSSEALASNNSETITFSISPSNLKGNKFVPTNISFDACRIGTDSGCIEVYLKTGNSETLVAELSSSITEETYNDQGIPVYPLYRNTNGKEDYTYEAFSLDVSSYSDNYSIGFNESFSVILKVVDLGSEKEIGLRNVSITGTLEQERPYFTEYNGEYVGESSVLHKEAKWYQDNIRNQSGFTFNDTFDDENKMVTLADNVTEVQATHVYTDTIYMIKGTTLDILIPNTKNEGNCSVNNYFRWFNYFDDTNYYLGEGVTVGDDEREDLLLPAYNTDTNNAWRFDNGYVSGLLRKTATCSSINGDVNYDGVSPYNTLRKVSFHYPSEDEFSTITSNNPNFNKQGGNDYYAVACDLSIYNDFSKSDYRAAAGGIDFASESDDDGTIYCEPTLAGRLIYYIVGIDENTKKSDLPDDYQDYWNLINIDTEDNDYKPEYHDGGNDATSMYYEEYEITFPSKHISNYTAELVALSKDAQSYAIPGENDQTTDYLNVAFAEGYNNGLTLSSNQIRGANRVISFYKGSTYTTWEVDNNSTATILVTKVVSGKTYNIARFKLTFKDECIPLTEPQVAALANDEEDLETYWWKDMTYRSKEYLEENYDLINSLNFDYCTYDDTSANAHNVFKVYTSNTNYPAQYQNYPFPLKWSNSSYAFYDGSYDVTYEMYTHPKPPGGKDTYRNQTSFCMYEIVNDYVGYGELGGNYINPDQPQYTGLVKNSDGCWLYVDSSDRPGTIAELDFEQNLCQGSEVVVTAWIKSSGTYDSEGKTISDDAAVTFTIMGVLVNDDGNETHTPIYRQSSGQIRTTTYLNPLTEEISLSTDVVGKGEKTNEWFQIYMSFINKDETDYDYYTIKIDNSCASTSGGDFYLDEINVYVKHSTVQAGEIKPICNSGESTDAAAIRIDFDYEALMSSIGKDARDYMSDESNESTGTKYYIDFIVYNRAIYDSVLAEEGKTVRDALEASIVELSYENSENVTVSSKYSRLGFYLYYTDNKQYTSYLSAEDMNFPYVDENNESDLDFYYRVTSAGAIYLSADYYGSFSIYTPYTIMTQVHDSDISSYTDEQYLAEFVELLTNYSNCAITSDFYVTSSTILKLNGELVDPTLTVCTG